MNQVELRGAPEDLFEHHVMVSERIDAAGIGSQRTRAASHQLRIRDRISASEQRHLVPPPDELFCQIGHDTFGPAVLFRRHAFIEWGDLRNFHSSPPIRFQLSTTRSSVPSTFKTLTSIPSPARSKLRSASASPILRRRISTRLMNSGSTGRTTRRRFSKPSGSIP